MKNKSNWKLPIIIGAGIIAVILLCVFGVQSSQNKAFALEEQVNTAQSDIKVQEKRRVDLVYPRSESRSLVSKSRAVLTTEHKFRALLHPICLWLI